MLSNHKHVPKIASLSKIASVISNRHATLTLTMISGNVGKGPKAVVKQFSTVKADIYARASAVRLLRSQFSPNLSIL